MTSREREPTWVYKHMVRGSAWGVATRWGMRAIGFVSVIVLARLLTPDDFGIVAIGSLTIGFIAGFTELGVQVLLIRNQEATREHADTAWTFKILQALLIALVLISIAPAAARYFDDPRVVSVLSVLAIGAVLGGAQNIGLTLARKDLDFALGFRFSLYTRLLQFLVTMTLAFALRSYWALVIGQVLTSALSVPLSFLMHPYRPKLTLAKAREYLVFGSALVPFRVAQYLNGKAPALVVGGLAGSTILGLFQVASNLSELLTRELLAPVSQGLMPNYAKLNRDPQGLAIAYRHVLSLAGTLVFPIGFGLSVVAADLVPVLLGSQWGETVPLVEMLALSSMLGALIHWMGGQILIASGHERRSAMLAWAHLAVLVPLVFFAGESSGVEAVARATVVAEVLILPLAVLTLTKSIALDTRDVGRALWRPFTSAVAMAAIVHQIGVNLARGTAWSLSVEIAAGAVVYSGTLLLLWLLSGRPRGFERVATDFILQKLSNKAAEHPSAER